MIKHEKVLVKPPGIWDVEVGKVTPQNSICSSVKWGHGISWSHLKWPVFNCFDLQSCLFRKAPGQWLLRTKQMDVSCQQRPLD